MEMSTYDAWMDWIVQDRERRAVVHAKYVQYHPEYLRRHLERQHTLDEKRDEILATFPYSVVAEGDYAEHDYASRWCWQSISPENGRCNNYQSTYPACPLVLATEYVEQGTRKDAEGAEKPCEWKAYRDPGEHRHEGRWTSLWLGKSGNEYGFNAYFFQNETDYTQFLEAFPTFVWDRSWDQ